MASRMKKKPEPTLPSLPDRAIDEMVDAYRRIRIAVYQEATRHPSGAASEHAASQQTFRDFVTGLCADANLSAYADNSPESRQRLWRQIWTKIRYAGIVADGASREIRETGDIFDDIRSFCGKEWELVLDEHEKETKSGIRSEKKPNLILTGDLARQYFERSGTFEGKYYYRNISKIKRTVRLARAFDGFQRNKPSAPSIDFLSGGIDPKNIWRIHRYMTETTRYISNITALHLMMDLGYEVMKPDRVMARAFFQLGWLGQIVELPDGIREAHIIPASSDEDPEKVEDEGRPSGRYHYIHPNISRPIVDLSRLIASRIKKEDLERDIGWCTDNKLREFDIFMVKYGQEPEPKLGLHRNLCAETPYEAFRLPLAEG